MGIRILPLIIASSLAAGSALADGVGTLGQKPAAVAPSPVVAALKAAGSYDGMVRVLRKELPDERERATVCLSFLGSAGGSWTGHAGLEDFAVRQLEAASPIALAAALASAVKSPDALAGAARWIIVESAGSSHDPQVLSPILRKIVRVGLAQSLPENRLKTVKFLEGLGTREARVLLRECLEGKFPLPAAPSGQPAGGGLPAGCPEKAEAAMALARAGETAIVPVIEKLLVEASVDEAASYRKALDLVRGRPHNSGSL